MGMYELAKRQQIDLDNIIMIGVNCGGTVSPVLARKMIREKFDVDPEKVHKEEIDKGQFIIEYEGGHKGISIDELEEAGFGRRSNCRRCKLKIPRQADLACGNWGIIGDKAGKATFVEVCSEKGAKLLSAAVKAGAIATEPANPKGIEIRAKVEGAMFKLGDKWRKHDFTALGEGKDPPYEDRERHRTLHQVLCLHRELPDLLLRGMQHEETVPRATRGTPGQFHVPHDPVCPHFRLLCQLRTVRRELPDGDPECPVHALPAGRDGEDVQPHARDQHGTAGPWICGRTHRTRKAGKYRVRSDLR